MINKWNVTSLSEFRERKELWKTHEGYQSYLRSLANSQLEVEINFLLDECSHDAYGKEIFQKGHLVLGEIASRADGEWKKRIEALTHTNKF